LQQDTNGDLQVTAGAVNIMIFWKQPTASLALAALATTFCAQSAFAAPILGKKKADQALPAAKLTATQNELVNKAIVREKAVIKAVRDRSPLVETYIQNMRPDPQLGQAPESDQHFLGRVDFGRIIGGSQYKPDEQGGGGAFGFFKHSTSFITGLGDSLHMQYSATGFIQMLLIDSNDFDREHYQFTYVRNEFLGNTPTAVFDVTPIGKNKTGRFFGRIWVETQGGNVVRFNVPVVRRTPASFITSTAGVRTFSPMCGSRPRSTWKRAIQRA
jgi:hypothetical protein